MLVQFRQGHPVKWHLPIKFSCLQSHVIQTRWNRLLDSTIYFSNAKNFFLSPRTLHYVNITLNFDAIFHGSVNSTFQKKIVDCGTRQNCLSKINISTSLATADLLFKAFAKLGTRHTKKKKNKKNLTMVLPPFLVSAKIGINVRILLFNSSFSFGNSQPLIFKHAPGIATCTGGSI